MPPPVSAAAPSLWWRIAARRVSPSTWGWCSPSPQLRAQVLAGRRRPAPGFYAPTLGDNSGQRQADVLLSVTPPPDARHPGGGHHRRLQRGEPWNQQAVARGIGVPSSRITDLAQQPGEGVRRHPAVGRAPPHTHVRLVKALLRAAWWLDAQQGSTGARRRPGCWQTRVRGGRRGGDRQLHDRHLRYGRGTSARCRSFNVFFRHHATYPYYSDAIWYPDQMRRWGPDPRRPSRTPGSSRVAKAVYQRRASIARPPGPHRRGQAQGHRLPRLCPASRAIAAPDGFIGGLIYDGPPPQRLSAAVRHRPPGR